MDVDVVAGKILGAEKAPAACRAHCLRRLMENGRKQVDTGVGLGGEGGWRREGSRTQGVCRVIAFGGWLCGRRRAEFQCG